MTTYALGVAVYVASRQLHRALIVHSRSFMLRHSLACGPWRVAFALTRARLTTSAKTPMSRCTATGARDFCVNRRVDCSTASRSEPPSM